MSMLQPIACERCGVTAHVNVDNGVPEHFVCKVCTAPRPRGTCDRCGRVNTSICMKGICPTFEVGKRSYPRREP